MLPPAFNWAGTIAPGANEVITLDPITTSTSSASHTFSYQITAMNGVDFNAANNIASNGYVVAAGNAGPKVYEGFLFPAFPPTGWMMTQR
jgi:hypothetical protein